MGTGLFSEVKEDSDSLFLRSTIGPEMPSANMFDFEEKHGNLRPETSQCCKSLEQIKCLACSMGVNEAKACMTYPEARGCERISTFGNAMSLAPSKMLSFVRLFL